MRSAVFSRPSPSPLRTVLCVLCALCGDLLQSQAATADEPTNVTYAEHVRPIFQEHCFACHSQDDKSSDLALDDYASAVAGGASGEVLVAGDPAGSRLWALVTHADSPAMPPDSDKLPDAQLALVKAWIEGGLLENASSKPKPKPTLATAVAPTADNRPVGEPAMPRDVLCEPVVAPARPGAVDALAASPWAPLVAVGASRQVVLYHAGSAELMGILPYPEGTPRVVRFSRDGSRLLVAGGRAGALGNAVLFDVATGARLAAVGEEVDSVLAADLSPDQSLVVVGGPKKVVRAYRVADNTTAYELRKHTDWITAAEFSPDGMLLATADRAGGVLLWDAAAGHETAVLAGHTQHVTAVAWRSDSQMLATAGEDGTLRLWDRTGKQLKSAGAHGGVLAIDFHRDGRLLSAGRDRVVKLWDGELKHLADLTTMDDAALAVRFAHDGAAAIVGDWSGAVRVVGVESQQTLGALAPNPPPLARRLELAQQERDARRAACEQATAALAAARTALASADAALARQDEERQKFVAAATAASQKRAAAAKRLAEVANAWQRVADGAAVAAQNLAKAEQALLESRRDLAAADDGAQSGADDAEPLRAAAARAEQAVVAARSAQSKAEEQVTAADAVRTAAERQAAAAVAAHRAAEADAAGRRDAAPAADLAAARNTVGERESALAEAASAQAAAEERLARIAAQRDAYLRAGEQLTAAASTAALVRDEARAKYEAAEREAELAAARAAEFEAAEQARAKARAQGR
ncbi:MAG: hypothetical protein KF847_01830 [Pirellulales bacterium]|nr:hypothetical protein [Pirellulales bacterium]